jgi:hypothetical protein
MLDLFWFLSDFNVEVQYIDPYTRVIQNGKRTPSVVSQLYDDRIIVTVSNKAISDSIMMCSFGSHETVPLQWRI